MNAPKKSLLERYGIPVNHLDFQYIAQCNDAREMEKMVHILRSGEEGYYPDLTKCAEEKLRLLKPHSRLFRLEEEIKGREALPSEEWKPIYDWNHDIKTKDKKLQNLKLEEDVENRLPPVRRNARISLSKKDTTSANNLPNKPDRIKSTDYSKWDKYDDEEEILRMDLAEERVKEEVERKNLLNSQKYGKSSTPKIEEILDESTKEKELFGHLSDIEKEKLSEEFRLRGNEYFRAKEYDNAMTEYTRAIQVCPEKAVGPYNNRAVTYFKQQKYFESIKDCEACLKLDPKNLKARLRLADASYAYGKRRESYNLYNNVLELDPQNAVALKAVAELRKIFEDLPPPNATRLQIIDEGTSVGPQPTAITKTPENITKASSSSQSQLEKPQSKWKNLDLADLVKPNRIVKNKIIKAAETLEKIQTISTVASEKKAATYNEKNEKKTKQQQLGNIDTNSEENSQVLTSLRMPGTFTSSKRTSVKGKPLIEEL